MKYSLKTTADKAIVAIKGDLAQGIDETLQRMAKEIKAATVEIDCAEVGSINSLGIRSWQRFLQDLGSRAQVEFHRCPTYFIDYANMFGELTTLGTIMSFDAPLKCVRCKIFVTVLLNTADVDPRNGFGNHLCPRCNHEMEAEVPAEDYLAFLDQVT